MRYTDTSPLRVFVELHDGVQVGADLKHVDHNGFYCVVIDGEKEQHAFPPEMIEYADSRCD